MTFLGLGPLSFKRRHQVGFSQGIMDAESNAMCARSSMVCRCSATVSQTYDPSM